MPRCTSSWGYAHCTLPQGHRGEYGPSACEGNGYRWQRGRGHMKPRLLHDPSSPETLLRERAAAHRLTFGVDRLPSEDERRCPAWPALPNDTGSGWKAHPKPSGSPYAAHHRYVKAFGAPRLYR